MLGQQGKILFPDVVEVLEIAPQQQYVYPIFKNGSTTLRTLNHRVVSKQELKTISNITVFVRDPHERFLSGVQTYIKKLGNSYEPQTVLHIISQHLYLNRHFCPQLYWILNLKRFTSATLTILPMCEISSLTDWKKNQTVLDPTIKNFFSKNHKLLFYNEMDEVLTVNLLGKTVTFSEIFNTLKENYGELYENIFKKTEEILDVLPKT